MKVTLGTLKDKGDELATFLEPRVGVKPSVSGDELDIEDGNVRKGVRPRHVKTYIKRFLYMNKMRKNYRVFVAGNELTVQEIELGEEEAKEKQEAVKKELDKASQKEAEPEADEAPTVEEVEDKPKAEKPKKAAAKKPRATKKKKAEGED